MMKQKKVLELIAFTLLGSNCNAFIQPNLINNQKSQNALRTIQTEKKTSTTSLYVVDEIVKNVVPVAAENARMEAGLWLVGASGGAGIARSAFPRMYKNVRTIQSLAGVGPTLGGEKVGVSPLCGLPEDLYKDDIIKIVNNRLTVEQMVEKGPKTSFWASKGYLTYDAYVDAMKGCNPLAVRAVFDTFNTNTDLVEPDVAQQKIDSYKADPSCETFKKSLFASKVQGFSAIIFLLFLLGLADIVAFSCASRGWFPDWPGTGHLPYSLINPGFWTIKDYWI